MYMPHYVHGGDIEQWLGGGWFWANLQSGKRIAAYLIESDAGDGVAIVCDVLGVHHGVELSDIQLHWPVCGAINTKNGYVLNVERVQTRQWRRTFNDRCVRATIPQVAAVRASGKVLGHLTAAITQDVIHELFYPDYPTWDTAVAMLNDRHTVALTPHVWMQGTENEGYLHYRGRVVGRASSEWTNVTRVTKGVALDRVIRQIGGPDVTVL